MSNKLTFGYLCDFRNPAAWHRPWTDLCAETLGFEGASVPEHAKYAETFAKEVMPAFR